MSQVEHEEFVFSSRALGLGVDPAKQVDITLGIEHYHHLAPAYVLSEEYFGEPGFSDTGCAQDQGMSNTVADVHPDVRLHGLDAVYGWIATNGGLILRLGSKQFCDPANQPGLQHVPLFGESRFMQPLRVSLVPVEAPAQKQSLGRPRNRFGSHQVAALAPQIGAVTDNLQPGVASPSRMANENAGESPRKLRCQQEGRWARHHRCRAKK